MTIKNLTYLTDPVSDISSGTKTAVAVKDIDIRNYAKFILIEGSMDEKREFLRCLKSEILLSNKKITLKVL